MLRLALELNSLVRVSRRVEQLVSISFDSVIHTVDSLQLNVLSYVPIVMVSSIVNVNGVAPSD